MGQASEVAHFMRTGNYNYNGNINNRTRNGNWWSTTSNSATNGRNLNTNPGNVNPQNNSYRGNGRAIRCTILAPFGLENEPE